MFRRSIQADIDQAEVSRLALFANTNCNPGEALTFNNEHLTQDFLISAGVTWDNISAARIDVATLKKVHKFECVDDLCRLKLDALELTDQDLMQQMINVYGVEDVRRVFASSPTDVATLIGTEGGAILGINVSEALDICAGYPTQAATVIRNAGALTKILPQLTVEQLLNSGLRRQGLLSLGLSSTVLINNLPVPPTAKQIRELGIEPRIF